MKFNFDTYDEYADLWQSVHDAIIYWKKVKQMAEGKINMNVDGSEPHYDVKYATDQMIRNATILKTIEDSPHPEWNGSEYEMNDGVEYYSNIIYKTLKISS